MKIKKEVKKEEWKEREEEERIPVGWLLFWFETTHQSYWPLLSVHTFHNVIIIIINLLLIRMFLKRYNDDGVAVILTGDCPSHAALLAIKPIMKKERRQNNPIPLEFAIRCFSDKNKIIIIIDVGFYN